MCDGSDRIMGHDWLYYFVLWVGLSLSVCGLGQRKCTANSVKSQLAYSCNIRMFGISPRQSCKNS